MGKLLEKLTNHFNNLTQEELAKEWEGLTYLDSVWNEDQYSIDETVKEYIKCIGIGLSNAAIIHEIIVCSLREDSKGVKNAAERLVKNLRSSGQNMLADGIEKEINKVNILNNKTFKTLVAGKKCDYDISFNTMSDSITNI